MIQETDVVAILNSSAGRTAIWHVDINPVTPLGRLCGAWVVDDPNVWRSVLATRLLLPVRDQHDEALDDAVALTVGALDPSATRERVVEAMNDLDARHRASLTAAGKPRADINWPRLRTPLSWDDIPPAPRGVVGDPFIAETIAVARWVADLAEAWLAIETARTSREHLAAGDPTVRPFPVVLTEPAKL